MDALQFAGRCLVRGLYNLAGLDSPYSAKEYGPNWTKQRNRCLDRDGRQCRVCGVDGSELDRELAVHHITPRTRFDDGDWRAMNDLSNLVTLCHSCHGRFERKFVGTDPDEFVAEARQNL